MIPFLHSVSVHLLCSTFRRNVLAWPKNQMSSAVYHQRFDSSERVSQSLCNDRCQNILFKAAFEHFIDIKRVAALLLASKSFQNSSFGANFIVNFVVEDHTVALVESVLSPSSCFSIQFVPSIHIKRFMYNCVKVTRSTSQFVGELVKTKYFHLSLRSLTLENVSDEVLEFFFGNSSSSWTQLQDLNLEYCRPDHDVLETMTKSAIQLRSVSFWNNGGITDASLLFVSKLSNITSLNLRGCFFVSDIGLEHISRLSNMTDLDLRNCNNITDAGVKYISQLSGMTSLDLTGCSKITDAGIGYISKLENIVSLSLSCFDKITDAALEQLSKLVNITYLNVSFCYEITDAGVEHLSNLANITSLHLRRCSNITDAGLEHLGKLSKMISLDITFCNKIMVDGKKKFSSRLPNCKIIVE